MAVNQICAEKDLPLDIILEAIEEALVHAYRRNYANNTAIVKVHIDQDTGELHVFCEKNVVETVEDPNTEIDLAEASKFDPEAEVGGTVQIEHQPTNFGRIAAQTAKQVILQRIHEAERDALFEYYRQREGELITGTVQSIDYRTDQVNVSLGRKVEGVLAREDQLYNERYRIGQGIRCLLAEVRQGTRGPQIRLSRTHRDMLRRLLEREVPEIYNGVVEIKSVAREPGQRSKIAVAATQPGVDPVGSCVGMRGTRIQNIVDELNGEKIDVVEWSSDVRQFISNALSPARPSDALLIEEDNMRTAIVVVPDRQLSLAIGKEGQNARLAAKLTGWRIDIKSETEAATEGMAEMKRQQVQLIRARSLDIKASAAAAPTDDLLGRAEWILREKDKTATTLERAAQLLADTTDKATMLDAERPAEEAEVAAAEVEPESVTESDTAQPEVGKAEPSDESLEFVEEYEEEEEEGGTKKGRKRSKRKTANKKRELVYDEQLGELVSRRKRKPGRRDWSEELLDY